MYQILIRREDDLVKRNGFPEIWPLLSKACKWFRKSGYPSKRERNCFRNTVTRYDYDDTGTGPVGLEISVPILGLKDETSDPTSEQLHYRTQVASEPTWKGTIPWLND